MLVKFKGCPKCKSNSVYKRGSVSIKDPRYGLISLVDNRCNNCFRRFRTFSNGKGFYYYN